MRNKTVGVVSVAALLAGGVFASVTAGGSGGGSGGGRAAVQPPPVAARLVSFDSCGQFMAAVKAEAIKEVGPYGLAVAGPWGRQTGMLPAAGVSAAAGAAGAPAAGFVQNDAAGTTAGSAGYSSTNDQEAGVDEPDTVKTNGRILVALRQYPAALEITDVAGLVPRRLTSFALPQAGFTTGMFLTGSYVVVLSQPGPGAYSQGPHAATRVTRATVVSVADPAHPAVVRSFDMTGSDAGARLIAGRVVVILTDGPHLAFSSPSSGSVAAQAAATEENRSVIESSTPADWLPEVTARPGNRTITAGCGQVLHSAADPGVRTVSVETLDPASDQPGPETTVLGAAQTVYASTDSLYVASWAPEAQPGGPLPGGPLPAASASGPMIGQAVAGRAGAGEVVRYPPGDGNTEIAGFDLSDPARVRYLGSGQVPGQLIGQYALSAYRGDLRVATTVGQATPPPGEGSPPASLSDSRITVLAPQHGSLAPVGSITGLGRGEKIYGVRFIGPLAYVVTFRQTDPLYIVDLADPARPVLDGQLQLTGFSSFLQPLDGSLLLGVGQGVDPRLHQTGAQLSVFDVADRQAPALRSRLDLGVTSTAAQYDPHALLWWPGRRLVAMPMTDWRAASTAMDVWHVGPGGSLQQVASLTPPGNPAYRSAAPMPALYQRIPQRAVVAGNLLYTVSQGGIMATDMITWSQTAWIPFS